MVSYIVIFMPHLYRQYQIGSVIKVLEDIGLVVQNPVKITFTNRNILQDIPERTDLFEQWKSQYSDSEYRELVKNLLLGEGEFFVLRFWHENIQMPAKDLVIEMRKRYPQYGLKNGSVLVLEDKTDMVKGNYWHVVIEDPIKML